MATESGPEREVTTAVTRIASGLGPDTYTPIVSDELADMMFYILFTCIGSVLSYAGVITNLLAFVTFVKMGFHDTINISLIHLVFWDFWRSLFMVSYRFNAVIHLFDKALQFSWVNINTFSVSFLWAVFGYLSGALAGYISLERCLCVSRPFSVKYLVTRRFVVSVNTMLSLLIFGSFMPYFGNLELYSGLNPVSKETAVLFRFIKMNSIYDKIINFMGVFWLAFPFFVMCVCSVIIVYYLKKGSKFRSQAHADEGGNQPKKDMSSRDRKVTKMLLAIVIVYLITTFPRVAFWIIRSAFPQISMGQREDSLFYCLMAFVGVFDCINNVANLFVFYFMSTQFKEVFVKTFKLGKLQALVSQK